jgi:hypothetical protein
LEEQAKGGTGAVQAVIELVAAPDSITILFSPGWRLCVAAALILSSIASAHGDAPMSEQAEHRPHGLGPTGSGLQIDCVAPGKAEAFSLTMSDAKIRYTLRRGATSFIIRLAAEDQRRCFTLENENMAAEGRFSIAVSNERLAADNPRWSVVAGAVPFRHKRLFDLSLIGVEAEFVKVTFQVDDPEKITGRAEPDRTANRFTVQP